MPTAGAAAANETAEYIIGVAKRLDAEQIIACAGQNGIDLIIIGSQPRQSGL